MTESAYFSQNAQKRCFNSLGVEEYEIVATLDSRTCGGACAGQDGEHYPMKMFEPGVTAPPFHPRCRCCTAPYFNDEWSKGERAARDEDGETYYVPSDMTYKEWYKAFVDCKKTEVQEIIREQSKRKYEHSDLVINNEKIQSAEYHKAFQDLGESSDVARSMWSNTKKMLNHRNGSEYEDLIYIDSRNGKSIVQDQYSKKPRQVEPTKRMKRMVKNAPEGSIIAIHNHAYNSTPSVGDLASAYTGKYKYGIIACHNGNLFKYSVIDDAHLGMADMLFEILNKVLYNNDVKLSDEKRYMRINEIIEQLYKVGIEFEVILI